MGSLTSTDERRAPEGRILEVVKKENKQRKGTSKRVKKSRVEESGWYVGADRKEGRKRGSKEWQDSDGRKQRGETLARKEKTRQHGAARDIEAEPRVEELIQYHREGRVREGDSQASKVFRFQRDSLLQVRRRYNHNRAGIHPSDISSSE